MQNITYDTFSFSGESINCYGLEIVKENLKRNHGIDANTGITESNNPIMVSLYWPEQLFDFIKWRYQSKYKDRKIIVGGNYPTTSPNSIAPFVDAIFLGDGELWDGKFEGKYIAQKGNPKQRAVVGSLLPTPYEDLQNSRRTFAEISRGCKNKCLFCQYGWLKKYREVDYLDIEQIVKTAKTKAIRVFAADRFQHKSYNRIRQLLEKKGKNDTGSDVSIRFLLDNPEYLKHTKKIRVGVEGLSHRLRRSVLKNFSNDEIVRFCKMVSDAGIKCLDWYMIYGLPGERKEDCDEFEKLINMLDDAMPFNYTIAIHWNAFTPSAQTPLQWCSAATANPKYLEEFFKKRVNKKIKIMHKPTFTSEWTLIRRMVAMRGFDKKFLFNFAIKESQFKNNPEMTKKLFKDIHGFDLMSDLDLNIVLPWDIFCDYDKNNMIKAYNWNKKQTK